MEVLALVLILYFRVIITAHGNTLPLTTATSHMETLKVLTPDKEALNLNNFPITEPVFLQLPNLSNMLPEIENGVSKSEILLDPASPFPPSLTNSFLNFEGNSAVKDFTPSVSQSIGSSVPSFGCNSFTNDFSGARCLSNFKALRDSIDAYANFISSSNSVFKLPMTIQSSGDSISKSFDVPFDSFTLPDSTDELKPPCVQPIDTLCPHFSFLNLTDSCPIHSQDMFSALDFPRTIETCESPLLSHPSHLLTHAPYVKSFDAYNPDLRLVSDTCQSCSQSVLPLLDFPRNIETCQSPLMSCSQSMLPVCDSPMGTGRSSILSQSTSLTNVLPTVSSLSTVNVLPQFHSIPSFSSTSAFSLPITVSCIDCNSCSLCPLPPYSPTFSVQEMIEDCIVSTPNTLEPPILPMSSSYPLCTPSFSCVSMCSPSVFDSFLTDDMILNECPKVPTTSSLPLLTDRPCMISVKNLLPSSKGAKSKVNSLSPVSLALPSSLSKRQLATTPFPLLPKSPISLFNNSFFEIPNLLNRISVFDKPLVTPISSTDFSPTLSLPSASILTSNQLTPSLSCLTPSPMLPIPSSLSSNCLPSSIIDLPSCSIVSKSCNISSGSSIVSDQLEFNTFSHVPFSNFFDTNMPNKELVPEPNVF